MSKETILRPHLLEGIDRLRKFVELNAPGVIVGAAAANVFATCLATYGTSAGSTLLESIMDKNLHERGICSYELCTNYVERPDCWICQACQKKLGIDDASLEVIEEEAKQL